MELIELILMLVLCHLVGDYVLQIDYIAKTKGSNIYHLIVHCLLYCLPLYICFGLVWQLIVVLVTHFIIDILKAKYKKINYVVDQVLHYIILLIFFF